MEKQIKEIADRLKTIVRDMLTNEEDMESKSFGYEEGIVISGNDAQLIISALSKEEHAAIQGYREALQEVLDECKRTDISITHIVGVVSKALSKAEDRGEVIFHIDHVERLLKMYDDERISFSKFCERLDEIAKNHYHLNHNP
jgi:hypothetical protein